MHPRNTRAKHAKNTAKRSKAGRTRSTGEIAALCAPSSRGEGEMKGFRMGRGNETWSKGAYRMLIVAAVSGWDDDLCRAAMGAAGEARGRMGPRPRKGESERVKWSEKCQWESRGISNHGPCMYGRRGSAGRDKRQKGCDGPKKKKRRENPTGNSI